MIPESALTGTMIVVGESHRQPRSHRLVRDIIRRVLDAGRCVDFALEVSVSVQDQWRAASGNQDAINAIRIDPIFDSASLRDLMTTTSTWTRRECLNLHAIDGPNGHSVVTDRDRYMARRVLGIAGGDRLMIVLVGNLHAVRSMDWDESVSKPSASLTARLENAGLSPYVVLQDWVSAPAKQVIRQDSPFARKAVDRLLDAASVTPAGHFSRYADTLIQWPKQSGAYE
ncbi:hypothetical protein [Salinisphaera orenii]|uniref:hypothetical protein n=1 Tax=Salinisphaera orenii TaxID=856731 RepID=UPI000DBE1046